MSRPATSKPILDREAWIDAATETFAEEGLAGIRVETLAKALGVTKGSFYWHFDNRDDLLLGVLERWKDGRIRDIVKQTECEPGKEMERIAHVLSVYSTTRSRKGMRIELAVRDWAGRDPRAAAAVREVDAARFDLARRLFLNAGLSMQEASSRSILVYAYVFGQSLMDCERFDTDIEQARADIFGLIQGKPR